MKIEYKHIPQGYTMKVRMYPTKKASEIIDSYFLALEKAANITLWELKQHNPEICKSTKNDSETLWPNFGNMAKASWLNYLRSINHSIANLPGSALSSSVGGLFLCDMQRAWEMQGKLPIDDWFDKRDEKGHRVLKFYGQGKKKSSYFLQINAGKFERDEQDRIYVTLPKDLGRARLRGWYENITFGEHMLSFFEYYSDNPKKALSCRISKNSIGEYYLTIQLQDVNRRYKVHDNREPVGIDVNLTKETGVVSTSNGCYENKKFKAQVEARDIELHRRMSRRYGISNDDYRNDLKVIQKMNKKLLYEDRKPLPSPSKRYQKADMEQKRLSLKVARRREYYQHQISANEVGSATLIGIESLSVKNMMQNNNLSKSLSDAAFYSQLQKLRYKGAWADIPVIEVGEFFASSHICPTCGHKFEGDEKFGLEVREWTCPDCHTIWNRDEAAAENIKREALEIQTHPEKYVAEKKKDKPKKPRVRKDKILDKNNPNIIIHFEQTMIDNYKNPWVVQDIDGNILDNAQGYGYNTAQKAQKAYKYKYVV